MGRPSYDRKIIAVAADDTVDVNIGFRQFAIAIDVDSYALTCSNESFMTVNDISVMCCNLCYVT